MKEMLVIGRGLGEAIVYSHGRKDVLMTLLSADSNGVVFLLENIGWETMSPNRAIRLGPNDRHVFCVGNESVEVSMKFEREKIRVGSVASNKVQIRRMGWNSLSRAEQCGGVVSDVRMCG